jgi:hypothetical protein
MRCIGMLCLVLMAGCANSRSSARPGVDAVAPLPVERTLEGRKATATGGVQTFCGASPIATNGAVSECAVGQRCDDRGDGVKVCMGGGSEDAWCVATADCGYGLGCRDRHCRP